ncbi:hypothetical protein RB597_008066 [Gaeumannomyces tritici]
MFSTTRPSHPRMPGTLGSEMPLLGNGDLHWVTLRRDASEGPRPAMAALTTPSLFGRGGSPREKGTKKKKREKSDGLGRGWPAAAAPAVVKSTDAPGETAGQVSQDFWVVRGTRATRSDVGFGDCAGVGRFGATKKGKVLSMVPRAVDFIRRKCGARRKAPGSGGEGEKGGRRARWYGEGPAGETQGSQGRYPAPYPLSGGKLTMTDWQLYQAKEHVGLPTLGRSEVTLVDENGTKRRPVFPECWWIHMG